MTKYTIKFRLADIEYLPLTDMESAVIEEQPDDEKTLKRSTFSQRDFERWCAELEAHGCPFEKIVAP